MTRLRRRLVALIARNPAPVVSVAGPRPCRFCHRIGLHAIGCSRLDRLDSGETS